jgi:hypothetical protein
MNLNRNFSAPFPPGQNMRELTRKPACLDAVDSACNAIARAAKERGTELDPKQTALALECALIGFKIGRGE